MHQPKKSPGSGGTAKDIAPNTQDDIHMETGQVSFSFRVSRQATEKYSLHCHNFYEVYLFLEGDADYLVEGKKYRPTPDSLLLLSPHCFHGVRVNSDSPYRRYSIHFHPSVLSAERRPFLLSAFPTQAGDGEIYFEQADRKGIVSCFEALADCAGRPQPLQSLLLPIYVEALLARIVSMARDISGSAADAGNDDTVSRILLYLNRHVSEPVTLDLLCERFYISKHHLNKVFRRATGTTVFDYLLRKRVILAQELLAGGMSAQEAAARAKAAPAPAAAPAAPAAPGVAPEVVAAIAAAVACTESGAVVRSIRRAPAPAGSTPRRGAWGQAGLNAATRPFLS